MTQDGDPPELARTVRVDRAVLRVALVLALAFVVVRLVTGQVTTADEGALATWRLWLAAAAAVVLAGAFLTAIPWRGPVLGRDGWPRGHLVALSAATLVMCLGAPVGEIGFIPFAAVYPIARSLDLRAAVPLLVPPMVGQAYLMWCLTGQLASVAATVSVTAVIVVAVDQARRRREAQELEAAQAAILARERARTEAAEAQRDLAAQIHDVLAHSLSGLTVSLQVASLQARQEGTSTALQERLDAAHALAREGLRDARDAVDLLRRGHPTSREMPVGEAMPQPDGTSGTGGADDPVADLVGRLRAATGVSISSAGSLTAIAEGHRAVTVSLVREALTNSVRHAPGLPIEITLRRNEIRVLTSGDIAALAPTEQVSGHHGLDGLRHRVEASGGVFTAGPVSDGWEVAAQWQV